MQEIKAFLMIPRELLSPKYNRLSPISKLMYGLLFERYRLSRKNGWADSDGKTYIYYPIKSLSQELNISECTAGKHLKELELFDLIKREKRGKGRPDKIKLYESYPEPEPLLAGKPKRYSESIKTYNIADFEKLINT